MHCDTTERLLKVAINTLTSTAKFNCSTDQSLVTDRHGHLKKNWLRTLLREIELGHTLILNVGGKSMKND
jgi:hypothetical protein